MFKKKLLTVIEWLSNKFRSRSFRSTDIKLYKVEKKKKSPIIPKIENFLIRLKNEQDSVLETDYLFKIIHTW